MEFVSSFEYRSYNGQNNNLQYPQWGSAGTPRIRKFPSMASFYTDTNSTSSAPRNETNSNLPSARRIMEEIFREAKPHKDKITSHIMLELGLFIVQDILGSKVNNSDPLPIPCDGQLTDYVFCPVTGKSYPKNNQNQTLTNFAATAATSEEEIPVIPFYRWNHVASESAFRATINHMTPFLDLSNIYGVNESDTAMMRRGGKIFLTEDGLAPDDPSLFPDGQRTRMNTSPGSHAIYIVFMRYHNRMAEEYAASGELDDDKIFELARRKTIAVYQSIVEEKYLPTLLGDKLDTYEGYNPDVDSSIDEFFASVSFRYGHTSLSGIVRLLESDFHPTPSDPLLIRDVFRQNVSRIIRDYGGVEPFLRGLAVTPVKAVDASFVDDLNLWAGATSVMDVQRAREVGIPPYNDVREALGLARVTSFEELVGMGGEDVHNTTHDDIDLVAALKNLYHNNIDLLDAYVGAVSEARETSIDNMGPLFTRSIKEQFTRLRDGDRFWYKATFSQEEYESFPDLSKLLKIVCDGMELFPDDAFLLPHSSGDISGDEAACDSSGVANNQLSFLGGDLTVRWQIDEGDEKERTIDVTLSILKPMEGPGYIGIGWNTRQMLGADVWFCTVRADRFRAGDPLPSTCQQPNSGEPMFSCCLAPGTNHDVPQCISQLDSDSYYSLEVVDWCLSSDASYVTVRTVICSDNEDEFVSTGKKCFQIESTSNGRMDLIVAYNPMSQNRPHGYQRRTDAQVDLRAGIVTQSEAETADSGLIATHGVFMMIGWMILAPWGVFIVRYMKTRQWRLVAHISIMGSVGSMMVPLLIGVQASVGASDKIAQHSLVGLTIMGAFFAMAATGRFRYLKWEGQKIGKRTDFLTLMLHRYGGTTFIALAWWNCYTGLVRIGPEDSYFELVLFSTYSMGYNMDIFGVIRKYIYGPYIAFVVSVFFIAEIRKRRSTTAQMTMEHAGSLWDDDGADLDTMTMETFLDVTRLGNSLCIVDGRVLDLTNFIYSHPGGPDLLRYVRGSDITEEFLGRRGVDGISHVHSQGALLLINRFVKAKLVKLVKKDRPESDSALTVQRNASSKFLGSLRSSVRHSERVRRLPKAVWRILRHPKVSTPQAFRRGKVVNVQYLSPTKSGQGKPVILLRLSLPRQADDTFRVTDLSKIPGCTFRFRGIDKAGNMFEREYIALSLNREVPDKLRRLSLASLDSLVGSSALEAADETDDHYNESEFVVDFVISLIDGGSMSNFLLGLKTDKILLAQGPKCNSRLVNKMDSKNWASVVLLAAGTGVVGMLPVIDYYLSRKSSVYCPALFLIWMVHSPACNYHAALGLEERITHSMGRLKLVTVYTPSSLTLSRHAKLKKRPYRGLHKNPFASSFSGPNTFRSSVWTKRKPKVNDLIVYAQLDECVLVNDDQNCAPFCESHLFDGDFWGKPSQCVSMRIDQITIKALMTSLSEHSKVDQSSFCETPSDAESGSSEGSDDYDDIAANLRTTITVANRIGTTGLLMAECFEGKQVVDCLVSLGYASSRDSAARLGQEMVEANIFRHVNLEPEFADDESLYQFAACPSIGDQKGSSRVFFEDQEHLGRTREQPTLSTLPHEDCSQGQHPRDMLAKSQSPDDGELAKNAVFEKVPSTSPSRKHSIGVAGAAPAHCTAMPAVSTSVRNGDNAVRVDRRRSASLEQRLEDGDIDDRLEGPNLSFDDMLIFVSGPPVFEASLIGMLLAVGLPREQVVTFVASSQ